MSQRVERDVQKYITDEDQMALGSFYAYTVNNPERKPNLVKYVPVKVKDEDNIYKGIGNVAPNAVSEDNENSKVKSKAPINGKYYKLDMAYSDPDGTDVQVWTNVKTGESVFVAQGSQSLNMGHRDGKDDLNLGRGKNPAQYKHAYDIYKKVNEARANANPPLPPITKLVGNSLGGGVVGYIGKQEKDINNNILNVLAINPSPVPGMVGGKYSNIKIISGDDDVLSIASKAIGIFPCGDEKNVESLAYGSYFKKGGIGDILFNMVYYGHLGADPDDENGYELGHVMPISFIDGSVLSDVVTGKTHVDPSKMIYVDPLLIKNMIYSLTNHGETQMGIISKSIKKVDTSAKNVSLNVIHRQAQLLVDFNLCIEKQLGFVWTALLAVLIAVGDDLNSCIKPLELIKSEIDTNLSVLEKVSGIPGVSNIYNYIKSLSYKIDDIINHSEKIIIMINSLSLNVSALYFKLDIEIPKLFQGTDEGVGQKDGMPWAIKTYSEILDNNHELLLEKFNNYLLTLEGAANTLEKEDSTLAGGISKIDSRGIKQTDTYICSHTLDQKLKEPDCIRSQNILINKQKQLDNNYEGFKNVIGHDLANICGDVHNIITQLMELGEFLEEVLGTAKGFVKMVDGDLRTNLNGLGQGWIINDIDYWIINPIMNKIKWMQNEINSFMTLYGKPLLEITHKLSYPSTMMTILDGAKPYVDEAIYGGTELGEVMMNSQIAKTAIDSLNAEFNDVTCRLDTSNRGAAITALVTKAGEVSNTLQQFSNHMDKLIV